ncbi:hypothetical protein RRF57_010829 [Xylaria bambusicola]|uniref:Uncharacterized protein n=1 Tax=Xylaria bambusicola TaxID=326684 RepID=A0AAN7Z909_9PEZI
MDDHGHDPNPLDFLGRGHDHSLHDMMIRRDTTSGRKVDQRKKSLLRVVRLAIRALPYLHLHREAHRANLSRLENPC